ncbi:A24 family peptidase [Anaerolineales bacterium HSG25]|nr:A24 family peptidase [Anaerolineales bacterium HSG25]
MIIIYLIIGWLIAMLINHAANLLPRRESIWQAPTCTNCQTKRDGLMAWSMLVSMARNSLSCPTCQVQSETFKRAIVVEIVMPLLFIFLYGRYGASSQTLIIMLYTAILVLITVTDLEHKLIFNLVMLPAILLVILLAFVTPLAGFWEFAPSCNSILHGILTLFIIRPDSFWSIAIIGGATGFIISYGAFLFGTLTYGRGALGAGDVTLSVFLGLILGLPYILLAFIITVFLGAIIPLMLLLTRRISRKSYIPYGPFLTLSGWLMLVWGDEIWQYIYC